MSANHFLKSLPSVLNDHAVAGVNCTIQFNVAEPTYATISDSACTVANGTAGDPNVTLTIADDDLISLFKGDLDGITAFMTGKLQVEGDLMLAQQISGFFNASKLG
ncbi:SCP2 sterol-binding domain-containing protein [Pseudomonas sp. BN415]|uniref:SCP2 sterol-binding domain-containing protein n=1 Tax=Pseudomonas sp. BN415 TaxID=2567889 RepID=UPI00245384B4|nr:SCP2 sterol-binding domain-containing protein [Pseudomonas sp. BN415]MDH4580731.1 SCP2 sterol-binding domain-containing protein [Pseudomonas sp. BN415]